MAGRLYLVQNSATGETTIVRTTSPTRALNHVTKSTFVARMATADDVAEYMSLGGQIEVPEDSAATDPGEGSANDQPDAAGVGSNG